MTRAQIKRLPEPYRSLRRAVHAAPSGQKAKRWKELRAGVAEMLKSSSLTLAASNVAPSVTEVAT